MRLKIFVGFIFVFMLESCIIKETDYMFYVVNNYNKDISITFFNFPNQYNNHLLKTNDTLKAGTTYMDGIFPVLTSDNFNDDFYIIEILNQEDSISVSEENVNTLNKIENWTFQHVEDIRYYQNYRYTLVLSKENLGF